MDLAKTKDTLSFIVIDGIVHYILGPTKGKLLINIPQAFWHNGWFKLITIRRDGSAVLQYKKDRNDKKQRQIILPPGKRVYVKNGSVLIDVATTYRTVAISS